jgi:Iodothyronine deiodinase
MESNDRVGVSVAQPTSNNQRVEVATQCHDLLEMSMPVLVDGIDDRVGHAYSGMPDRLYIIDREGNVAFKSGRGPFWFNPAEMEQALIMMLLEDAPPVKKAVARVAGSVDHGNNKP